MREEHDSMGTVMVPDDRLWGAQTQRSYENFKIGSEKMPKELISALVSVKRACARANRDFKKLDDRRCGLIEDAAEKILREGLWDHFPLSVWQTGSGTQTNMNANEVIARLCNLAAGEELLHPNDHVNMSQSTNDIFPTAIHVAGALALKRVIDEAGELKEVFSGLAEKYRDLKKSGRTHLQDATPITFGQEASGWARALENDACLLEKGMESLCLLPVGGTAVGTGINAPAGFGDKVAEYLKNETGIPFSSEKNKFFALSMKSGITFAHGTLKTLACDLMKIANDVRWLSSGPRCGLGEIKIPENEPGSSIMPGKVNPTQCEAMTMAAVQIMGNDAAVGFASSQGNFELNVYMPLLAYDLLQSAALAEGAMRSFRLRCALGITADEKKMGEYFDRSLMRVTALSPKIGYDNAAKVAHTALSEGLSLGEAAVKLGFLSRREAEELLK